MSNRHDVGMAPAATIDGGHRAALSGVVFAVLFVVGFALLDQVPLADATDADLDEFYAGSGSDLLVVAAFYIVPFAGIAFLWFLGALRHRVQNLTGTEDTLLATVQLLSGVLFVAMTFTSAAAGAATVAAIEIGGGSVPSATETRQMLAFAQTATMVFALRTAAVFVAAGTTRARRAGLFPRWFAVASYALTLVLLLATTFFRPVVVLFPAWVTIVSILVLRRVPLGSGRSSSGPA